MAHQAGRSFILKQGTAAAGTVVAGARSLRLRVGQETVDVTDKDSTNQWRDLLAAAGVRSMSVEFQGVVDNSAVEETIRGYALNGSINAFGISIPTGGAADTIDGSWMITQFEMAGEYNGAVIYNFTLESSGPITYTAGA